MRTIKFRGKREGTGEWVYGDLLTNNGNPIIVLQVNRDYISRSYVNDESVGGGTHWAIETPAYLVDPSTVGQFIGLFDKDGKEVYEHDIFPKGVIGFSRGCFNGFYTESRNDEKGWGYSDVWEDLPHTYCYAHSVLGNIHDDNNLLKDEE